MGHARYHFVVDAAQLRQGRHVEGVARSLVVVHGVSIVNLLAVVTVPKICLQIEFPGKRSDSKHYLFDSKKSLLVAERVGFEPTVR